ncbi:glycosyltransferase family 2 protein [Hyphomonas sp.]|uniref:glycosyltransferase family 2 protein n=1 Tax=Alphaproteobacteria TaxID=28211 RepID=UPI003264B57D
MQTAPAVSIIISAYNRPKVVPFAIKSVLASDFEDWELIIIGDGCNVETEEAIRAFVDPRIRFENVPANTGHQSGPHNRGVELARGEFVLFLNQDDIYFPDHVSARVAFMRESGADISWSPILLLNHSAMESGPVDVTRDKLSLDGATADGNFDPESFVISSCWAVRREICNAVGPWLTPDKTRLSPSQEWLHRASRQGRNMAYHPRVSVLCIHSGVRRFSYVNPESPEHERAWSWLEAGTGERLALMQCVAVQQASERVRLRKELARRDRPFQAFAGSALARFGIHPHTLQRMLEGLGKGEWVGKHTHFTAKPPPLPFDAQTPVGTTAAGSYIGRGWHVGEGKGRWSSAATAEVFFSVPEGLGDDGNRKLEISGYPMRDGDEVTFRLNDGAPVVMALRRADRVIAIDLPAGESFRLRISVDRPTSPLALGRSMDGRILGYWLEWLRVSTSRNDAT